MQTLKVQLAKDWKQISTKIVGLKKVVKKMSVKNWLILGSFAFVTVGLLVAMYAARLSSENRSGATGGGPQYYFQPASAVLTKDSATGVLQPVQNIQVNLTVGRPIVSYSFVMKLTYADGTPVSNAVWSQVTFVPNPKFITNQSALLNVPGTKLFAGTIDQQPGGVTTLASAVSEGKLGSFRFEPVADQPDLRMSFFAVPNKPQANAAYVLGSILNPPSADGEVVIPQADFNNQFNLHNPFLVVGSPTPVPLGAIVKKATLQYAVSNGAEWRQLDARFNDFNNGGTVKSLIRLADIDPSWRVEGLSPAFRLRIKNAQGVYKQTTIGGQPTNVLVNFEPRGSIAEGQFWVNWKVEEEAGVKYIKKSDTTDKLRFDSGDTIEVTINLHRQQNGVSYTCKETDELVVAPIGRPEEQQVMGPCVNDSLVTVTYGAGLAPGTCQCDLGVVMDTACGTGTVATCTSQFACSCLSTTPTATPTPTTGASGISIGNRVFKDLNDNGVFEPESGETGIGGFKLSVHKQGVTTPTEVVTDVKGEYLLTNQTPGTYSVSYCGTSGLNATIMDTHNPSSVSFDPNTIPLALAGKDLNIITTGIFCAGAASGQYQLSESELFFDFGFHPEGPTLTPTPTSGQQAFVCPVITNQIPLLNLGQLLPTVGSNRFITSFSLTPQMKALVSTRWTRIVFGNYPPVANPTVVCDGSKITTINGAVNPDGSTPAVTQSTTATPCSLSAVGSYVPQTLFRLTNGSTVTCNANSATVVRLP